MNDDYKSMLMVSIRCLVYNHEPYLRQCLDGFVMQQTNFRFEAIIHDDASTDGSTLIIKEYAEKYPDIIKPIYEVENQYSKKNGTITRIMDAACTGKYIAMCEGDDYWIDPLKLQKQVDFLEANPEYVMCFHAAKLLRSEEFDVKNNFSKIENREYSGIEIFEKWQVPTASVIYRRDLIDSSIYTKVQQSKKFIYGDTPLFCAASCIGKLRGMSDIMSVYRKHAGGATAVCFNLTQRMKLYSHHIEFGNVFGELFEKPSLRVMSRDCVADMFACFRKGEITNAIRIVKFAFSRNTYYTLIALLVYPYRYIVTKIKCKNRL